MKKKTVFYTEIAYIFAILTLAFGTALMEKAAFGMSMVVAPAYILHRKISELLPWFTFGVAEYALQTFLLFLMVVVLRRFRILYLFSFCTAIVYGTVLDGCLWLVSLFPLGGIVGRCLYYAVGIIVCAIGVSLFFKTYIAPEAYELLVKEISRKFGFQIHKVKTVYDCVSCGLSVVLSFLFFGLWHFEGVKLGTVFCAVVNGYIISLCSKFLDAHFVFSDRFALRKYFE